MFALIECYNFYVSCERLFRPDLWKRPVLVLSKNDGYVIACSDEVKAIGIKLGEPYFRIKSLCNRAQVYVFLPNYPLYVDLSHRVMSVITELWPAVKIYSINEAFLELTTLPQSQQEAFCSHVQKVILNHTGIPTSVGLAPTKTLAKMANEIAKKKPNISFFRMVNNTYWLARMDVSEIWGVSRRWSQCLHQLSIHTALALTEEDPHWIKQQFSVVLQRTIFELLGESCIQLEEITPSQSIHSSNHFTEMQIEYEPVSQALSGHCAHALDMLSKRQLLTKQMSIFIHSNPFRPDLKQHNPCMGISFTRPTDNLSRITEAALFCLQQIFKPGIFYYKVGIMLTDFAEKFSPNKHLFIQEGNYQQIDRLMPAIDEKRTDKSHLHSMHPISKSPAYTTAWSDLPKVNAH